MGRKNKTNTYLAVGYLVIRDLKIFYQVIAYHCRHNIKSAVNHGGLRPHTANNINALVISRENVIFDGHLVKGIVRRISAG